MLRRKRQVRHEDEEVEQASEDDGGGLLEEAGEHVQWLVASGQWPVASGQLISYPLANFLLDEQQIPRCGRCGDLA